jgi:hypothetical protein
MMAQDPSVFDRLQDNKISTQKMMDECYLSAQTQWQTYWNQSNIDRRFALGDQRYLAGLDGQQYQNQKFCFNLIHAHRHVIVGHQSKHRKSSVVVPSEDRYQQVADDYSGCLMWTMNADKMLHKITQGFDTAWVTGLNLTKRWIDYTQDPVDGIVRLKNYAPTTCIMDPWWRDMRLTDCRFIWTRDFVSGKMLDQLIPGIRKEKKFIPATYNSSIRFTFMPESYQMQRRRKDNYAYDQFYYYTDREAKLVHSYSRSETYEVKGDKETIDMWIDMEFSDEEKEELERLTVRKPCINLAIAVNDKVVYEEYYADQYDFTPTVAYFDPDSVNYNFRFYGGPRVIRDSQYLFNRKMQIQLDVLESLPNSGIYVTEDALLDKNDAFKTGPGQATPIKKGYNPRDVVMPMQPPSIDPSAFQMTSDLADLSRSLLGITDELMGMADDSKTGIQEILRQGASLTSLNTLFDNLDLAQSSISHGLLHEIQNYSPSKVEKILGRPPSKDFYNINLEKFYVEIEDGLNTQTQKQNQFAQMITLTQEAGMQFSPQMMLKSSTLQNKQDYIDDVTQMQEQQAKAAQGQQQMEMANAQANIQLLQSQAETNRSIGRERDSKIADNYAMAEERRAKAMDELDDSVLRKIEAIKKLQELDLGHIEKFVGILQNLKELNQPAEVSNGLPTQRS